MFESKDLITVHHSAEGTVEATGARIELVVHGQEFFAGREVFQKAKELQELVSAVKELGIEEDSFSVEDVRFESTSGFFSKSTRVLFRVSFFAKVEQLSAVMARLAKAPNVEVPTVNWKYPELQKTQDELMEQCAAALKVKAEKLAGILGVTVQGVHSFFDSSHIQQNDVTPRGYGGGGSMGGFSKKLKSSGPSELLPGHWACKKTLTLNVIGQFLVAPQS